MRCTGVRCGYDLQYMFTLLQVDTSSTIRGNFDRRTFRTLQNVTCKSNNLIYALECTRCNTHYVGQTMNTLRVRRYSHYRYIVKQDLHKSCGEHFSQSNQHQGLSDIKIYVLEFLRTPANLDFRAEGEKRENRWQYCYVAISFWASIDAWV